MTSAQIRQSFLDFFREKEHTIVPSSSLLPDAPNLLFTNAGMNQFVPIFLGQQKPTWKPPRVADTQKCIRAGGKHNDLEDVGLDTYHHTFFEMLGNWSFGDYFKKEAIEWAWELVVDRWKFPAQRLYATVYKPGPNEPSEFDQEAYDHWARLFQEADLDPKIHVVSSGKADNFWMMGDTGPCGPCSELHVDLTPDGDTRGSLVNKDDPRCIEIWNLVFIQFNANLDGSFAPLPQRHVDTGMGFERATAIIQGTKNLTDFSGATSNYETDVFRPIFDEIEKLSGKKYASTLPDKNSQPSTLNPQHSVDIAFRVIADHIRTLSFAIGDGIIPSNESRGYVLRRVLRRAVRYGRTLGFHEPFFFKLVDVLAKTMGDVFPEVRAKQKTIQETIRREEESFNKTLDTGIQEFLNAIIRSVQRLSITTGLGEKMILELEPYGFGTHKGSVTNVHNLDKQLPKVKLNMVDAVGSDFDKLLGSRPRISGEHAFKLYDTYGFPLDLTELMARERGLTVDVAGFEKLMEQQRSRARGAQKKIDVSADLKFTSELEAKKISPTRFLGYDENPVEATVLDIVPIQDKKAVLLDKTSFYAEMGGQVGDTGWLIEPTTKIGIDVENTLKSGETWLHLVDAEDLPPIGTTVTAMVDWNRRPAIERHHTVTHLLHWALHELVSRDAAQKGSYVGPDKLTFDFSSAALSPEQKRNVEKLVNEKVAENAPVSWTEIPYDDAKKRKEIQQFFGEKYGDKVRVVQIGGEPKKLNGYSMELCGGTHVRATSEIGAFRIVKEEAIAAGTRRIEAVAGDAARAWSREEAARQQEKFETLSRKKSALPSLPVFTDTVQTDEMLKQIDARAAHLEKLDVDVREWEKQQAKAGETQMRQDAVVIVEGLKAEGMVGTALVKEIPNADGKLLQAVADALKQKFDGPIVLAGAKEGHVALVVVVPKALTSKIQANKIIQQLAPIVGGKGGGRPENAQGGGTDADKIDKALAEAKRLLT
jgi:alanyl-tRNA synthetase